MARPTGVSIATRGRWNSSGLNTATRGHWTDHLFTVPSPACHVDVSVTASANSLTEVASANSLTSVASANSMTVTCH